MINFRYIFILGILFLSSCSSIDQLPTPDESDQTPSSSLTGVSSQTGFQDETGSVQTPPEIVSVGAGETRDVPLSLDNGKGMLQIQYGTGARVNVHFVSETPKTLSVKLTTPKDAAGNIRVTQIIFPGKTSEGPFGRDMTYSLTQTGEYQIILGPNMMAGDPWSGEVDMDLELQ